MKTKLLKKLRTESTWHYGVFMNKNGLYEVVHDRDLICPDLSRYGTMNDEIYQKRYEVVEVVGDLELAKKLCDDYRRGYILRRARQMRFKNRQRYY